MTGMPVSGGLFDENRKFGISHKKDFIPFKSYGTTVYFDSIVPTQREITEYTHSIMTVETEWGPQSV